jgi:secreted trypsin-like serine protease
MTGLSYKTQKTRTMTYLTRHCRLLFLLPALILLLTGLPSHGQARETLEFSPKILGGTEAKAGDWPWIVAILKANVSDTYQAQYCSGVLIDSTWVLTAAHCVSGFSAADIELAVGAYDLNSFSGPRIGARRLIVHPEYNTSQLNNDIALIELEQASTQPTVTLFSGQSQDTTPADLTGVMLTALGWGMADSGSDWYYPAVLRQVDLPVVSNSYCNTIYSTTLADGQLCAGYYEGKDACNGDSGGPVVTRIDDRWVHAGLVSYGMPCDKYNGWYGVYTRTSAYQDFISQYVPGARFTSVAKGLPWLMLLLM